MIVPLWDRQQFLNFGQKIKFKTMSKSGFLMIICLLTGSFNLLAQGFSINRSSGSLYQSIPQEGIYIHQNSTQLFAGERLLYKVYCLNLKNSKLSELSKIAYVKLVDEEKNTVFSHKVRLREGVGAADFALPTDLATGSYKIIGFTSWMQSREKFSYFESDLVIINPYKVIPANYRKEVMMDSVTGDSITVAVPEVEQAEAVEEIRGDNLIDLNLDTEVINQRSSIIVLLKAVNGASKDGQYSISVKKLEAGLPSAKQTGIDYWSDKRNLTTKPSSGPIVVPELRGELYSGRVVFKEDEQGAAGKKVALSLPGDPYIFDIAQTDSNGYFFFNIDTPVNSNKAVLQLLEEDADNYAISFNEAPQPDLNSLEFPSFMIDPSAEQVILDRSINNQIENAYAGVKSDTVIKAVESIPFYRNYQQQFFLDDYTRFNTLRETMVEIIDNAWIAENGDNDPTFGVRPLDGYLESTSLLPMVVVDGLYIRDHKDVVDYNSKQLNSIAVSRDRVMIGPQLYQGLISLETKSREFPATFYRSHLINDELQRPEAQKTYFFQSYESADKNSRVPDFRYQLFWEPFLTFDNSSTQEIQLFSSDIKGSFVVELKGFTANGKPVALSKIFVVE